MDVEKILAGKTVLIVDDERDLLDSLVELLHVCKIDTAISFEEAKQLMETNEYDLAILDIMGVRGFDLLELSKKRDVPALMLTAHSLNRESLKQSAEKGASYFAPKDRVADIALFAADVIEARQKKKSPWKRLFERLGSFYDGRFGGTDWREKEKQFWEDRMNTLG
jgi:DNA-binding NtrC family response regulator